MMALLVRANWRISLLRALSLPSCGAVRWQSSDGAGKLYKPLAARAPSYYLLREIADRFRMELSYEELSSLHGIIQRSVSSWNRLNDMQEPCLPVKYLRTPGYRPAPEDNPYNAWYYKVDLRGADSGLLHGKTIAIKDNIAVAGVPMMNGSRTLEHYTPEFDATVVTRILDAGGHITGKAACEDLCLSGGSFTAATGAILNPHDPTRNAGGSSGGSGALVAGNVVDMALGGDQGGSIRMPASWCGIVGFKPTHGLVPYTGIFPIEMTLDHVGPMTKTVFDCAQLLEVIAGCDGYDPRQPTMYAVPAYTNNLTSDFKGRKIGIVKEGFGQPLSEADVDSLVLAAAKSMEQAGAVVEEVSIPMHVDAPVLFDVIAMEGLTETMFKGHGFGVGWKGHYATSMLESFARGMKSAASHLSYTNKFMLLTGEAMKIMYNGKFYAKAQNVSRDLRDTYDKALDRYDVIVMPTLPMKATKLPSEDCTIEEYISTALNMISNTCPFDVSGHPALTINAGYSEGLPVGMMIVGRRFDEQTVLNAAFAFETVRDRK